MEILPIPGSFTSFFLSIWIKSLPFRPGVSLVAQLVKNLPEMRETWVQSLGWEDPLEKGKATQSSIVAWRTPRAVQSLGSQRVGHDWATFTFILYYTRGRGFLNLVNPGRISISFLSVCKAVSSWAVGKEELFLYLLGALAGLWIKLTRNRSMHGGVSSPSFFAFIHRVAFEEVSSLQILIKSRPGNQCLSACGTTHKPTSRISSWDGPQPEVHQEGR